MIQDYIIEDFIGMFDCDIEVDQFIEYFKFSEQTKLSFDRRGFRNQKNSELKRRDTTVVMGANACETVPFTAGESAYAISSQLNFKMCMDFNSIVGECFNKYVEEYESIKAHNLGSFFINVQRTRPGEGYHSWHCERSGGMGNSRRILACMMYLNDDYEGGETEFLYQHKRITPKKGKVLIWPAGFTHTHRGNPPLSGEKYIATSWIESSDN